MRPVAHGTGRRARARLPPPPKQQPGAFLLNCVVSSSGDAARPLLTGDARTLRWAQIVGREPGCGPTEGETWGAPPAPLGLREALVPRGGHLLVLQLSWPGLPESPGDAGQGQPGAWNGVRVPRPVQTAALGRQRALRSGSALGVVPTGPAVPSTPGPGG